MGPDRSPGPFATQPVRECATGHRSKTTLVIASNPTKVRKRASTSLAADLSLDQRQWPPLPSAPLPPRAASYASRRLPRRHSPSPPDPPPQRRRCCARSPSSQVLLAPRIVDCPPVKSIYCMLVSGSGRSLFLVLLELLDIYRFVTPVSIW